MFREMKNKMLSKAFSDLSREDLEKIIMNITNDEHVSKTVTEEISSILTPKNLRERLIKEAREELDGLEANFEDYLNIIEKYNRDEVEHEEASKMLYEGIDNACEKFVPLFIERGMYKEALRFVVAACTTIDDIRAYDWEPDVARNYSANEYYEMLIKEGQLMRSKVNDFVGEYQNSWAFQPQDIFESEDVVCNL